MAAPRGARGTYPYAVRSRSILTALAAPPIIGMFVQPSRSIVTARSVFALAVSLVVTGHKSSWYAMDGAPGFVVLA